MYEVEIKAYPENVSPEEIVKRAEAAGFSYDITLRETDIYYNGNDRNFMKTDEALRIRSRSSFNEKNSRTAEACESPHLSDSCHEALITYKGPKLELTSSTRKEYETSVGHRQTACMILEALGYRPVLTVDKTRREFKTADGITLCIDQVKGLPLYVELETLVCAEKEKDDALHRLFQILHLLGIPEENVTRKSYLEMLLEAQSPR